MDKKGSRDAQDSYGRRRDLRYYPIALDLAGARALVAGGGRVAERKVISLLKAGARIRVVSPRISPRLSLLAQRGRLRWSRRRVRKNDVGASDIVIAATDNNDVNKQVSDWARKKKILVNVVDDPPLSDFISPAVFQTAKAFVAVHTDGKDPRLSRDLKNFLKENWDAFLSYRNRL